MSEEQIKNEIQRCEEFAEDIRELNSELSMGIQVRVCNGDSVSGISKIRDFMAGSEFEVRNRQTPCFEIKSLEELRGRLAEHKELYTSKVYLNWLHFYSIVELDYSDLVCDIQVMECAWYSIMDDLEIVVPGVFFYSIDHNGSVWYTDLSSWDG